MRPYSVLLQAIALLGPKNKGAKQQEKDNKSAAVILPKRCFLGMIDFTSTILSVLANTFTSRESYTLRESYA